MFKIYKQKGCLFECKVRFAANKTGCTPWDFPVPADLSDMRFCTTTDLFKFNKLLDNPVSQESCDCLPDCEEVTFETQVLMAVLCLYPNNLEYICNYTG